MQSQTADFAPDAHFAAIVYNRKDKQRGTPLRYDYLLQHGAHANIANATCHVAHCQNLRPSMKPEVHCILHCQRRTKPLVPVICTYRPNYAKFKHVVVELCERAQRHTATLI